MSLLASCSKELVNNDQQKITFKGEDGILHFNTPEDFISVSKQLTEMNNEDYLKWESEHFNEPTLYGNYVRALKDYEQVQSKEAYHEFIKKWEGKVRYTDIEKVDYFEIYPLYDAPLFIQKMITSESQIIVKDMVHYINETNYLIYPTDFSKDVSRYHNIKEKYENKDEKFYVLLYNRSKINLRTHNPCDDDEDHGGISCYARKVKGIFTHSEYDVYFTGTHWELLVEHDNEVKALRKQSLIWWATSADQVKVNQNMGVEVLNNGTLVSQNNSQIESQYNVSSHHIPWTYHFDNITNPNLSFVRHTGEAEYTIIDTGSKNCDPRTYNLSCKITH